MNVYVVYEKVDILMEQDPSPVKSVFDNERGAKEYCKLRAKLWQFNLLERADEDIKVTISEIADGYRIENNDEESFDFCEVVYKKALVLKQKQVQRINGI